MNTLKVFGFALIMVILGTGLVWADFHQGMCNPGDGIKGRRGGHIFRALRMLDLSDAQKDGIKQIHDKYAADQQKAFDNLKEYQENLFKAIHADEFNETDIRQAHQQVASAKEEMVVLRAKILSEIKPLLTPEQLEKLKSMEEMGPHAGMANGRKRMKQHWGGCNRAMMNTP